MSAIVDVKMSPGVARAQNSFQLAVFSHEGLDRPTEQPVGYAPVRMTLAATRSLVAASAGLVSLRLLLLVLVIITGGSSI